MQEAPPSPPSPPEVTSSRWTYLLAMAAILLGIVLCLGAFLSALSLVSKESQVIFTIKDPDSYGSRNVRIPKPSTPWLNLSLLALATGFLVSLRSLYLISRRKKAAIASSLLAAKVAFIGGTLLFAGIDFYSSTAALCLVSLLVILYATLTYWAYSSPRKLAAVLNRD